MSTAPVTVDDTARTTSPADADVHELVLPPERLVALHRLSPIRASAYLVLLLSTFSLAAAFGDVLHTPWARLAQWLVQGLVLSGLLCASHFCIHNTCWGKPIDRIVGAMMCTPLLVNFSVFRNFHLEHHHTTGTSADTQPPRTFTSLRSYFVQMTELRFISRFARWSLNSLRERYPHFVRTREQRRAVKVDTVALLAWLSFVVALTAVHPRWMMLNYWFPWAFFLPTIFLITVGEHYGCDKGEDVFRNTRTIGAPMPLQILLWHINLHGEHHIFPHMPCWNLSKLPQSLGERFVHRQPSYWRFHVKVITDLIAAPAVPAPFHPDSR